VSCPIPFQALAVFRIAILRLADQSFEANKRESDGVEDAIRRELEFISYSQRSELVFILDRGVIWQHAEKAVFVDRVLSLWLGARTAAGCAFRRRLACSGIRRRRRRLLRLTRAAQIQIAPAITPRTNLDQFVGV
jgi:hypothetical protein